MALRNCGSFLDGGSEPVAFGFGSSAGGAGGPIASLDPFSSGSPLLSSFFLSFVPAPEGVRITELHVCDGCPAAQDSYVPPRLGNRKEGAVPTGDDNGFYTSRAWRFSPSPLYPGERDGVRGFCLGIEKQQLKSAN